MAERTYRRDDNIRQTGRYAYIDGSTVRKLQTRPVPEKRETERRQEQPRRRKRTSAKTRRNRARALQMHLRDVIFLGIAGMIVVVSCINYLQKQALNTSYRNQVATQEAKLADLKERNDAAYESALKSVDLETIRNIAINKLGMVYAGEEQVKTYDDKSSDYVRQYSDVPTE